ncbi:MAG: FHA domain-containing protein [Acidimicrobiales bacterium]
MSLSWYPVGSHVEVWGASSREMVALEGDRLTLGKASSNDLALDSDPAVSRLHAVLERYPTGWCVRDLGSRNGTFLNGERVDGSRGLRPGDEVRLGRTRLVFRGEHPEPAEGTDTVEPAPPVTPRERDVLVELCRPLVGGDAFTEPASIRRIAGVLVVSDDAVKKHLVRLYDKFAIPEDGERRRVRLANAALERGAVTLAELRAGP